MGPGVCVAFQRKDILIRKIRAIKRLELLVNSKKSSPLDQTPSLSFHVVIFIYFITLKS